MENQTISIIGSGWLGLPLAQLLLAKSYCVKASTTSVSRIAELKELKIDAFQLDIKQLPKDLDHFFQANILIVNIPCKDTESYRCLIKAIEKSAIEKILFVSSTSVYRQANKIINEDDSDLLINCPLLSIERLFQLNNHFTTTVVRFAGLIGYSRNPGDFFKSGRLVKNPDSPINLIHRDDCINILTQIIEQKIWGEVFNGCADTHPTKRAFYTKAALNIAKPTPNFDPLGVGVNKVISNQKVKQVLNYKFIYPDLMALLDEI